jgi:hypothetical protein
MLLICGQNSYIPPPSRDEEPSDDTSKVGLEERDISDLGRRGAMEPFPMPIPRERKVDSQGRAHGKFQHESA